MPGWTRRYKSPAQQPQWAVASGIQYAALLAADGDFVGLERDNLAEEIERSQSNVERTSFHRLNDCRSRESCGELEKDNLGMTPFGPPSTHGPTVNKSLLFSLHLSAGAPDRLCTPGDYSD